MSAKLSKIGINSDGALNSFSKLQRESLALDKEMGSMGRSVATLSQKLSLLKSERDLIPTKNISDIKAYNSQIQKLEKEISHLQTQTQGGNPLKKFFGGLGSNLLATAGIGFGMFQLVGATEKGIEKAHALHEAEAQLKNTMQNMGTYSVDSFERTVEASKKMAGGINFSSAQIIGLQSQIRMMGNVGDAEMQRITMASADMASKFGMDIGESGQLLAKAVNNPEMMMRLGQRLKIDPAISEHLKKLAKDGHEAQARMELLALVEQRVGGAAKAAFDANPLNKYNKVISGMQMALGDAAIDIQTALGPALEKMAGAFKNVALHISAGIKWMMAHKRLTYEIIGAMTLLTIILNMAAIKTQMKAYWDGILIVKDSLLAIKTGILSAVLWIHYSALVAQSFITKVLAGEISLASMATSVWTGIQWALNAALTANPVGLIIIAIIALIAVIAYVGYKTDGWGKQWSSVVNFMKYSFQAFVEGIKLYFNTWIEGFMIGLDYIRIGWYKFKDALGIGNTNENQAEIAKIHADIEARKTALAEGAKKTAELTGKAKDSLKWELSWNSFRISREE